jgi:cyclophilin family peptidyl-prolyl cis-trans isomerase
VRLLPEQAPRAVAMFAALAQGRLEWFDRARGESRKFPYYDGMKVRRAEAGQFFELASDNAAVASEFFVPPTEGRGPVDYSGAGRLGLWREAGVASAARLFVTMSAQPWLNRVHPCFGVVVSGGQVVELLSSVKTHGDGTPIEPPSIERVRIFPVGNPEPLAEPEPFKPQRHNVQFNA